MDNLEKTDKFLETKPAKIEARRKRKYEQMDYNKWNRSSNLKNFQQTFHSWTECEWHCKGILPNIQRINTYPSQTISEIQEKVRLLNLCYEASIMLILKSDKTVKERKL